LKLSVVIPAKNEEQGLATFLPSLRALYPEAEVIVVDALFRRGSAANLAWLEQQAAPGRFHFIQADLAEAEAVLAVFRRHAPFDYIAHVGGQVAMTTSLTDPARDLQTNVLGTFAVLGNHDHWFGARRVRDCLERGEVPVLVNETRRLRHRGTDFALVGVDDAFTGHDDLVASLGQGSLPRLLVTHTPDLFVDVPAEVSLTVAAHTHGGQVRLPIVGALFVPSRFGTRYVRGHYVEEGRHLWVTSGVGNSMVPVRFGVPPELVVLTLRAARD
jgi:predicted MPP superfamily phosphohydrolase